MFADKHPTFEVFNKKALHYLLTFRYFEHIFTLFGGRESEARPEFHDRGGFLTADFLQR